MTAARRRDEPEPRPLDESPPEGIRTERARPKDATTSAQMQAQTERGSDGATWVKLKLPLSVFGPILLAAGSLAGGYAAAGGKAGAAEDSHRVERLEESFANHVRTESDRWDRIDKSLTEINRYLLEHASDKR